MKKIVILLYLLLLVSIREAYAQFYLEDSVSATAMAQSLVGPGVTIMNAQLNPECPGYAVGKFDSMGYIIGIDSGIVLTTGRLITVEGASGGYWSQNGLNGSSSWILLNSFFTETGTTGTDIDLLNTLLDISEMGFPNVGDSVNDVCKLEFDFVALSDIVTFDFVYAANSYPNCTQQSLFGFYISGPGYNAPTNIAFIPGTSYYISGFTVNNGGCSAPGGPTFPDNSQYYNYNFYASTDPLLPPLPFADIFTMRGYTDVFPAVAAVTPCETYHIKLAIGQNIWGSDGAVFLRAGSFSSVPLLLSASGGAGLSIPSANTVRGCPPGHFTIKRNGGNNSLPLEVNYLLSGSAVNGTDYTALPGAATIPAGADSVSIPVAGIVLPPTGPKSVIMSLLSPYACADDPPAVIATDSIIIYDSIYVQIDQADTAICGSQPVTLTALTDPILQLQWSPAAGLSSVNDASITATPTIPTTYTAQVSFDPALGVNCPASTDQVFIDVKPMPTVNIAEVNPEFCLGSSIALNATATPAAAADNTYIWTPATGLSDAGILNPVATPPGSVTYVLQVNSGAIGCDAYDSVSLQEIPSTVILQNQNITLCAGSALPLTATGNAAFSYHWTPETDIVNPDVAATSMTANFSHTITMTATHPNCPAISDSFILTVEPMPSVNLGSDRSVCGNDTLHLHAAVTPSGFSPYMYQWIPADGLSNPSVSDPVFTPGTSGPVEVIVQTPAGCEGRDTIELTVVPVGYMSVNITDAGGCPPVTVALEASGADSYLWSPSAGLSADNIANPVATPSTSTLYLVQGYKSGCVDSQTVNITVYPEGWITMPDSMRLYPGEAEAIPAESNGRYFSWSPVMGLSATDIKNPVASPWVSTRYYVNLITDEGCKAEDSIYVEVMDKSILDVPNAFVAGGANPVFKIVRRGWVKLHSFAVFNRWGVKVFETHDIDEGWDGTYRGAPQPVGVYIYQIEAEAHGGKPVLLKGNVTLLR